MFLKILFYYTKRRTQVIIWNFIKNRYQHWFDDKILTRNFSFYSVGATIGRPIWFINDFSYQKQISNLWFNHNSAGDHWSPLQKQLSDLR